jgi:DNA-binding PadR family transcriptional regulator
MQMKAQFYILGLLLRYGAQHGYMLKQTVEEQISDFTQIKLPTIYYHLEKMHEKGYVSAAYEKDGNRPERTVYSITATGEKYFYALLQKIKTEALSLELPLDGAVFFSERLNAAELSQAVGQAAQALTEKLNYVIAHRDRVLANIPQIAIAGTKAIFNHHIYHMQAELKWLNEMEGQ